MFENLHDYPDGAAFSHALTQNCLLSHGVPAREFIKLFIDTREESIRFLRDIMNKFKNICNTGEGVDGQVHRGVTRFALVAAAGELASHFGITGWKMGTAILAAQACFKAWLSGRGGSGKQEELEILAQVRLFFEQHGESRFTPWERISDHKTILRAGYKKIAEESDEPEYYVFPETFRKEICRGHELGSVVQVCLRHGLLRPGSKGEPTRSEKLPGHKGNKRFYRFTSKVLGDDDSQNPG